MEVTKQWHHHWHSMGKGCCSRKMLLRFGEASLQDENYLRKTIRRKRMRKKQSALTKIASSCRHHSQLLYPSHSAYNAYISHDWLLPWSSNWVCAVLSTFLKLWQCQKKILEAKGLLSETALNWLLISALFDSPFIAGYSWMKINHKGSLFLLIINFYLVL